MHLTPTPTAESTRGDTLRQTGSEPAVEPGGRCRRYGVPTGPRWAARGHYFVLVTKVRGASDGRFTSSEARPHGALAGPPPPPRITLYYSRPPGRPASLGTPCVDPRRGGPQPPLRRRVESHAPLPRHDMRPSVPTLATCTATFSLPPPTSLVYTRPAPGFEPREVSHLPPPPPPNRVRVEEAYFAFGVVFE